MEVTSKPLYKERSMAEEDIKQRLDGLKTEVDETCTSIEAKALSSESSAESSRRWDIFFRASTAILAVAAPALVTYSVAQDVSSQMKLFAILLTAVAGASTTLQAIFGFKQGYVRGATTSMNLRHIVRDLRSETRAAFKQSDKIEAVGIVRSALDRSREKVSDVLAGIEMARVKEYNEG